MDIMLMKKSISEMTDEEIQERIRDLRHLARTPKANPKVKKAVVSKGMAERIDGLDAGGAADMLATLEDLMEGS